MQYQKAKSVSKQIVVKPDQLERIILQTMRTISDAVGRTLGPGGRPVLLERQEDNLPPMITKDGVTVYRNLGFDDPVAQVIMESGRDASLRTASEAGDGTTTAAILSEAVVRLTYAYAKKNPRVSPQRIVRRLEKAFQTVIEPQVKKLSIKADLNDPAGRSLLRSVAKVSANGDEPLADAVMECFDLVGDDGNVTISEINGTSRYEVERIEGFPIATGFEECAGKYNPKFINDPGNQRVLLDKPWFVVFHGRVQDPQSLFRLLSQIGYEFESNKGSPNVVIVSTGFSDSVLGYLASMFAEPQALNVYPLMVPQTPFPNGQLDFMLDIAAITGATVLDPLNCPLDQAELNHFGSGVDHMEAYRFRSNVVGKASEDAILLRVDHLQTQLSRAESQLDTIYLQERIGKLTGGIARLKVSGASNGELKEKRDRAEDAVCAVRGAIKHGCLPGGGWTLLRLMAELKNEEDPIISGVLIPALFEPFRRLLENVGVTEANDEEFRGILEPILARLYSFNEQVGEPEFSANGMEVTTDYVRRNPIVYDALESKHVDPVEGGILDSTPAVLEAIRNSLSIAAVLGTTGAAVVYKRDLEVERREARDAADFVRNSNINEADERT